MSERDALGPPDDEWGNFVEIVILVPGTITEGMTVGRPRPFTDLQSALEYAATLPPEAREVSFIRTNERVRSLADVEAEENFSNAKLPVRPQGSG
jgi:hypothetical protein